MRRKRHWKWSTESSNTTQSLKGKKQRCSKRWKPSKTKLRWKKRNICFSPRFHRNLVLAQLKLPTEPFGEPVLHRGGRSASTPALTWCGSSGCWRSCRAPSSSDTTAAAPLWRRSLRARRRRRFKPPESCGADASGSSFTATSRKRTRMTSDVIARKNWLQLIKPKEGTTAGFSLSDVWVQRFVSLNRKETKIQKKKNDLRFSQVWEKSWTSRSLDISSRITIKTVSRREETLSLIWR